MKIKESLLAISFLVIAIGYAMLEMFINKNYTNGLLITAIVSVTYYLLFIFENFELLINEDTFQITNSKNIYRFEDVVKVDWVFHSKKAKSFGNRKQYTELVLTLNSGRKVFIDIIYISDFWTIIEKVKEHNPNAYFADIIPEDEEDFWKLDADWRNNVSGTYKKVLKGIVKDNAVENNLTEKESKKDLIVTGIKELAIVGGILFMLIILITILTN